MKTTIYTILLAAIVLVACGPKINPEQQKGLTDLSLSIDSINLTINGIDSAELMQKNNAFLETKSVLLNDLKDTVDRNTIFYLDSFVNLRKPFGYLSKEYSPLKKESKSMKIQMQTLAQDVENRLVDEEHFDNYYGLELNNYHQLKVEIDRYKNIHSTTIGRYNKMKPRIDSIIEAINSKANE